MAMNQIAQKTYLANLEKNAGHKTLKIALAFCGKYFKLKHKEIH